MKAILTALFSALLLPSFPVLAFADTGMYLVTSDYHKQTMDYKKAESVLEGLKDIRKFSFPLARLVAVDVSVFPSGLIFGYTVLANSSELGLDASAFFSGLRSGYYSSGIRNTSRTVKKTKFQHILFEDLKAIKISKSEIFTRDWNPKSKTLETKSAGGEGQGLLTLEIKDHHNIQIIGKEQYLEGICSAFEAMSKRALFTKESDRLLVDDSLQVVLVQKKYFPTAKLFSTVTEVDGNKIKTKGDFLRALSNKKIRHKVDLEDSDKAINTIIFEAGI